MFVLAGTVAGFVGILSFHSRPVSPVAVAGSASHAKGEKGAARQARRTAPPSGVRSVVGATEQYGFGELAVKVTVRGSRITDLSVPLIQTAEQYSQQLASQVIPTLRSEVLSAQTANISAVSGATYTSQAYAASVQAALDKLHPR
jgi:uncharacterized protein with FMN-binding domain